MSHLPGPPGEWLQSTVYRGGAAVWVALAAAAGMRDVIAACRDNEASHGRRGGSRVVSRDAVCCCAFVDNRKAMRDKV